MAGAGCRRFDPARKLCNTVNVLWSARGAWGDDEMNSTNITIKVDSDLARDAKVFAARHGTSLSRLVAQQLERLVRGDQVYSAARRRALARLRQGYDMGGEGPLSREEVNDRESIR